MTEYSDIVEEMRAKLKAEKEGRKIVFVEASNGTYLIKRKNGSTQKLSKKEWLNLLE